MLTNNKRMPGMPVPHRGPLTPMNVMASTSRTYRVVVPLPSRKVITVEQWSPDSKAGELNKAWGVKATLEVV